MEELRTLVEAVRAEYETFMAEATAQVEKGNKAAGGRARKASTVLGKQMAQFRKLSVAASK